MISVSATERNSLTFMLSSSTLTTLGQIRLSKNPLTPTKMFYFDFLGAEGTVHSTHDFCPLNSLVLVMSRGQTSYDQSPIDPLNQVQNG